MCSASVPVDTVKAYGAAELQLWSLLSSTVDTGLQSVSPPGYFPQRNNPSIHWRWGGYQRCSGRFGWLCGYWAIRILALGTEWKQKVCFILQLLYIWKLCTRGGWILTFTLWPLSSVFTLCRCTDIFDIAELFLPLQRSKWKKISVWCEYWRFRYLANSMTLYQLRG
jgi:hypothetical protein